jgi:hypothetical protein
MLMASAHPAPPPSPTGNDAPAPCLAQSISDTRSTVVHQWSGAHHARARFQDVGRVHCTFALACTHERMDLSMKRIICPSLFVTSLTTDLSRSSNSPLYFARLSMRPCRASKAASPLRFLRHITTHDPLGKTLHNGRFAKRRDRQSESGCSWCGATESEAAGGFLVTPNHGSSFP